MNGQPIFDNTQTYRDAKTGKIRRIRGAFDLPVGDTPGDSVKAFLFVNADAFGIAMEAKDLQLVQDVETPTGRIIRYEQTVDGIPVVGTEIQVRLDRSARVQQVDLSHVSPADVSRPAGDEKALTPTRAIKIARDSLGEHTLREDAAKPVKVYLPTPSGLRLAYEVLIPTRNPAHDWRIIVDAYTGDILSKEDLIWEVNGQGLVFDPNPVVTAGNNTYRDPTATVNPCGFAGTSQATIDAQRVTRTLNDITYAGGKHKLEGPYVKLRNFYPPNVAPPEETSANDFNYQSNNDFFEAVMVYYHVDHLQRYIQNTLGITNANNRQTEADAHDNAGDGGGFYYPIDLGLHFGDSGSCKPDRAEDADCIYHEYNHAIMDNVKPGYGPKGVANPSTGLHEARALGEGFGDILACVYFAPDHPYQREVFEDWCFADEGGMRRVDGTKVYPASWLGPVFDPGSGWYYQEHPNGEIWSAALWNIYRTIGGDAAGVATQRAARDELLKTMISSYFTLTTNPNMMDAAEAMMDTNAGISEYRLTHGIEMLNSFHDRGVLHCTAGSNLKITDLWSQQSEFPEVGWQQVEKGQDNWFYARVRNDGGTAARAAVVTFSFQCPYVTPIYPADWRNHIISAAVIYDLAPGATVTVHACFPNNLIPAPLAGGVLHGCILAEVYNPVDHVPAGCMSLGGGNGKLYQRNTDVVDAVPGDTLDYQLVISNYHIQHEQLVQLEVMRPEQWEKAEVWFGHRDPRVIETLWQKAGKLEMIASEPVSEVIGIGPEIWVLEPTRLMVGGMSDEAGVIFNLARGSTFAVPRVESTERLRRAALGAGLIQRKAELVKEMGQTQMKLLPGHVAGFPYVMQPRERTTLDVHFKVPADAKPGEQLKFEVIQRNDKGELIGGFDVLVNVIAR